MPFTLRASLRQFKFVLSSMHQAYSIHTKDLVEIGNDQVAERPNTYALPTPWALGRELLLELYSAIESIMMDDRPNGRARRETASAESAIVIT